MIAFVNDIVDEVCHFPVIAPASHDAVPPATSAPELSADAAQERRRSVAEVAKGLVEGILLDLEQRATPVAPIAVSTTTPTPDPATSPVTPSPNPASSAPPVVVVPSSPRGSATTKSPRTSPRSRGIGRAHPSALIRSVGYCGGAPWSRRPVPFPRWLSRWSAAYCPVHVLSICSNLLSFVGFWLSLQRCNCCAVWWPSHVAVSRSDCLHRCFRVGCSQKQGRRS